MPWKGPFDARWLRRWTLRLGIATCVVLLFPVLTVFALISIIGIPLGMIMLVTPTLFVAVAFANMAQRLLGRDGPLAVGSSFILALVVLAGVATTSNAILDHRADEYLAEDLDTLERPLTAGAIGIVALGGFRWSKGEARCNELCQRLLLSGAAQRVVTADLTLDQKEWSAATPAHSYHLEERERCPPVHVAQGRSDQAIDNAAPDEALRFAMASGRCLIEEDATLADADAVIATGRLHRGQNDYGSGLSLMADTVSASRASVHVREGAAFVERYRWTGVTVLRHPFIPVPTLVGGAEFNMRAGFFRNSVKRNARDFAQRDGNVDAVRFAGDELGLDVAVPENGSSPARLITNALDSDAPLQPTMQRVIEDYFASIQSAREVDESTRLLAFRALADPRVVAPRASWAVAKASAKSSNTVNDELASILFRKLMATDPALREDHPSYLGYPVSYLATAIATLPVNSIRGHRRELEELAHDSARRQRASRILPRLSVFGADAVPTLLFLVEEGCSIRERRATEKSTAAKRREAEDWQDVFGSGLAGLCRLGAEGSAALAQLMQRLHDGTLPLNGANRDLLLQTLVRIGADPEELREAFGDAQSPETRTRFDKSVERARTRPECRD